MTGCAWNGASTPRQFTTACYSVLRHRSRTRRSSLASSSCGGIRMFISKDTLARAGAPGTSTPNSGLAFSLLPALLLASCGGGSSGSSSTSTPTPDETPSGPTISITSQPANGTQDPYGRIAFEAAGAARFTCAIDGGVAAECSSPFLAYPLEPGDHVVRVVAYDAAGNAGEAANAAWPARHSAAGSAAACGASASRSSGAISMAALRRLMRFPFLSEKRVISITKARAPGQCGTQLM